MNKLATRKNNVSRFPDNPLCGTMTYFSDWNQRWSSAELTVEKGSVQGKIQFHSK